MAKGLFFKIFLRGLIIFNIGTFNPLCQKVLADDMLDFFSVFFFIHDPAHSLIMDKIELNGPCHLMEPFFFLFVQKRSKHLAYFFVVGVEPVDFLLL
jgi:hypothetical protein